MNNNMNNEMKLVIENLLYDTAECKVWLCYDPTDESLEVMVFSNFTRMQNPKKKWIDMVSYGECCLEPHDPETLREIADLIKNEPWLQIIENNNGDKKAPFKDEKTKQAVLERLYKRGEI